VTDLDRFRARLGLEEADVLLFPFGSRVYGTARPDSDHDYLAVAPPGPRVHTGEEFRHGTANVTVFNSADWADQLMAHKVHCLEAYFLPDGRCRRAFSFVLDRRRLYVALTAKASESWERALRKLDAGGRPLLAWKGIFHALRILHFGVQIATLGTIADYGGANGYWRALLTEARTERAWHEDRFGPEYFRLAEAFRQAT